MADRQPRPKIPIGASKSFYFYQLQHVQEKFPGTRPRKKTDLIRPRKKTDLIRLAHLRQIYRNVSSFLIKP